MSARLRHVLLAIVLAVLATLLGSIGISPLLTPGYLLLKLFAPVAEPLPGAPLSGAVLVSNVFFWLTLFVSWALLLHARRESARRS